MGRRSIKNGRRDEGAALISALWISLILSLLAIALIASYRSSAVTVRSDINLRKIWMDSDSLTHLSLHKLSARVGAWQTGREYTYQINGNDAFIYITPSTVRLDLNIAPESEFYKLFMVLGYLEDEAVIMAAQIADYRDSDNLIRLNGAEEREYASEGREPPKNSRFENIAELGQVLNIGSAELTCMAPFITVFSGARDVRALATSGSFNAFDEFAVQNVIGSEWGLRRGSLAGQVYNVHVVIPRDSLYHHQITTARFTGRSGDPVWTHLIERRIVDKRPTFGQIELPNICPIVSDEK